MLPFSQSIIDLVVRRFVALRYQRGWSQGKAAQVLDVDKSYYSRIEGKKKKPSLKVLQKMAYLVITKSPNYSVFGDN